MWEQVSGKEGLCLLLPEQRQNVGFRDSRPELNKELDYLVSEHRGLEEGSVVQVLRSAYQRVNTG